MLSIGYGYWGFLGDTKYTSDKNGNISPVSTPDGNAFYSWSIIRELQNQGHDVVQLMPDRDEPGFSVHKSNLFGAWATEARTNAYMAMQNGIDGFDYHDGKAAIMLTDAALELDFVLWEWRWEIPGRNDVPTLLNNPEAFQPDYLLQDAWLRYFKARNIPVIVFDLDYKLTKADLIKYAIAGVIELGNKWNDVGVCASKRVQIPFGFRYINTFDTIEPKDKVVYIGNRYERDWCVNKYLPNGTVVYGNWNEGGRTSGEEWPNLTFRPRLQTHEMQQAYAKAAVTPLLAKRDYCEQGFMTARLIEAVFYGCVPLFIKEFVGNEVYIPKQLSGFGVVSSKSDVSKAAQSLMSDPAHRTELIHAFRYHLSTFMDAKYFVQHLLEMYDKVR